MAPYSFPSCPCPRLQSRAPDDPGSPTRWVSHSGGSPPTPPDLSLTCLRPPPSEAEGGSPRTTKLEAQTPGWGRERWCYFQVPSLARRWLWRPRLGSIHLWALSTPLWASPSCLHPESTQAPRSTSLPPCPFREGPAGEFSSQLLAAWGWALDCFPQIRRLKK